MQHDYDDDVSAGLIRNLAEMERGREAYWRRYPKTSPTRLRWRAQAVRHALHVTAGDSILELGAGSGLWTRQIVSVLKDSSVTAAVFNDDLARQAELSGPEAKIARVSAPRDLPVEQFDFVVGAAILSHDRFQENLDWIAQLLRPGGRLLFFEANYWNPQVFIRAQSVQLASWSGNAECQVALRKPRVRRALERQGFADCTVVPYDILHPRTPAAVVPAVQAAAFVAEHLPGVRELCGNLFIGARKPGTLPHTPRSLVAHQQFHNHVSVVVPCHNEEMNVPGLVGRLIETYDEYIREIVIVNDNSTDGTAAVVEGLAAADDRICLVNRLPPAGVGRALRDGYAATTGDYVLSIDCDFQMLVPELRDLFDAVAAGHEGAIGSRFSHESVLLNYPPAKMLGNRLFHLLLRVLIDTRVRDISNNLKLYKGDILRGLEITQDGFAANAETGLAPILAGRDIQEVPIAWINREADMGASSFRVLRVAPGYAIALVSMLRRARATARG